MLTASMINRYLRPDEGLDGGTVNVTRFKYYDLVFREEDMTIRLVSGTYDHPQGLLELTEAPDVAVFTLAELKTLIGPRLYAPESFNGIPAPIRLAVTKFPMAPTTREILCAHYGRILPEWSSAEELVSLIESDFSAPEKPISASFDARVEAIIPPEVWEELVPLDVATTTSQAMRDTADSALAAEILHSHMPDSADPAADVVQAMEVQSETAGSSEAVQTPPVEARPSEFTIERTRYVRGRTEYTSAVDESAKVSVPAHVVAEGMDAIVGYISRLMEDDEPEFDKREERDIVTYERDEEETLDESPWLFASVAVVERSIELRRAQHQEAA